MEAASLSVSITGDASGLISSLQNADAAIAKVHSSAGKLMSDFNGKDAKMTLTAVDNTAAGVASAKAHIASVTGKTVTISVRYAVSGMPKFASGTTSAAGGLSVVNDERGKSDPRELIEHNGRLFMYEGRDVIVPLGKGDRVYTADETKRIMAGIGLPHYAAGKNNTLFEAAKSDFTHYKKTHDVSPSEELSKWQQLMEEFAYDEEAVWEIEENIFSAQQKVMKEQEDFLKEQQKANEAVYKKWQSDAKNWKKIRDTYGDWDEAGDSHVKFYERSIERIKEMYEDGYISWQTYRDDTMSAVLSLYEAKEEQTDALLKSQKKYIASLKKQFADEESALGESWDNEDRRVSKAEISRELKIYAGAVTQRGLDKYKSLQDEMKKLRREEEMYRLQKSHTETITRLEDEYAEVEDNKKYLLGVIERSGLNIESIAGSAKRDIESMQSTVSSLFRETINAIKAIRISQSSYSDNRNISINGSGAEVEALKNRMIGEIARGSYY